MQITLFKALRSLKLNEVEATAVVESLEQHVESVVNTHIRTVESKLAGLEGKLTGLEGKMTGLQTSMDAIRIQLNFVSVMIGIVGLAMAAAPIVAKFIR
jgi:hypothetical protein